MTTDEAKNHIVRILTAIFTNNTIEQDIIIKACEQIYRLGMVEGVNQGLEKLRKEVVGNG